MSKSPLAQTSIRRRLLVFLVGALLLMGLVAGLPTSVQIYADSWREDLCLEAAEIIERAAPRVMPVDPHPP